MKLGDLKEILEENKNIACRVEYHFNEEKYPHYLTGDFGDVLSDEDFKDDDIVDTFRIKTAVNLSALGDEIEERHCLLNDKLSVYPYVEIVLYKAEMEKYSNDDSVDCQIEGED